MTNPVPKLSETKLRTFAHIVCGLWNIPLCYTQQELDNYRVYNPTVVWVQGDRELAKTLHISRNTLQRAMPGIVALDLVTRTPFDQLGDMITFFDGRDEEEKQEQRGKAPYAYKVTMHQLLTMAWFLIPTRLVIIKCARGMAHLGYRTSELEQLIASGFFMMNDHRGLPSYGTCDVMFHFGNEVEYWNEQRQAYIPGVSPIIQQTTTS